MYLPLPAPDTTDHTVSVLGTLIRSRRATEPTDVSDQRVSRDVAHKALDLGPRRVPRVAEMPVVAHTHPAHGRSSKANRRCFARLTLRLRCTHPRRAAVRAAAASTATTLTNNEPTRNEERPNRPWIRKLWALQDVLHPRWHQLPRFPAPARQTAVLSPHGPTWIAARAHPLAGPARSLLLATSAAAVVAVSAHARATASGSRRKHSGATTGLARCALLPERERHATVPLDRNA